MKTRIGPLVIGLVGAINLAAFTAHADLEVSASVSIHAQADFYAPLTPHGAWIEVGSYGRCWHPVGVAVGWRPYCEGHWVWTDCGWYWESDEPWAWACYHYGSWYYDPVQAWVWVPGVEWAPAWVSWRSGGGYIGWAPLAPRGVVVAGPQFVFVASARFQEPVQRASVIVNNTTIINKTTVISGARRETREIDGGGRRQVVVNEGPGVAAVQKATGRKIQIMSIREASRRTPVPEHVGSSAGVPREQERGRAGQFERPQPAPEKGVAPREGRDNKSPRREQPSREQPNREERPRSETHSRPFDPSPAVPPQPAPNPNSRSKREPGKHPDPQAQGQGKDKPNETKKDQ